MTNINKDIFTDGYQQFLLEIVNLVQTHRTLAVKSVQTISNQLYWSIGEVILKKQQEHGWGKAVVEQLSRDLNRHIGEGVSWSPRNLWFMRQLVDEYSNLSQPVSGMKNLKQLVSEVPWGHNILILQKVKDIKARVFYLQTTIKNRYSRSVLLHQIEAEAYKKYLLHPSQHNFDTALPAHLLEQAQESIKSIYSLDFLDINKPITERMLEATMVQKVKRLMMELGYGFCFVGKLDFYLQLIDEQLKQPDDQPSIGILLVPHKDQLEVEYALRTAGKPIGVAQYTLSKKLPNELHGKLPSAEEFQQIFTLSDEAP